MVIKNELQSLLGLLFYITKCVKPARFFLTGCYNCQEIILINIQSY